MVSFDSANGPSETTRPFLPETIFPSRSSGLPAIAVPSSFNQLNQVIHWSKTCCICSGERPLYQSVPRKISMYPFCDCVLIGLFRFDGCELCSFNGTTNGPLPAGHLFCVLVAFPDTEGVVLRILTDGEEAHARDGRLRHANLAAELLDLRHESGHRRHVHVIRDGVCWVLARHQPAIGRGIGAASVDLREIRHPAERTDLPAKQFSVERLRARRIVGGNFKPDYARGCFGLPGLTGLRFRAHNDVSFVVGRFESFTDTTNEPARSGHMPIP